MRGGKFFFFAATVACVAGIAAFVGRSEGNVSSEVAVKEIVVPLVEADRSALAAGDTLRKAHKYREAITAYQIILETTNLDASLRAEAEYDIGLSHTWLGEYDAAEKVFARMLDAYKNDPNAVGYAEYCLAWVEIQKEKPREAITRLEKSIGRKNITDRELAARTQFLVGRTHLMFLNDQSRARESFSKVLTEYPETKIAQHPYIAGLKEK